jgi:hypothetical protein
MKRGGIVSERAADLQDADLEDALGDVGLRPPCSEQLLLRDDLAAVFDQATENRERLWREGHHVAVVQKLLVGEIQGIALERQERISFHRGAGRGTASSPRYNPDLTIVPSSMTGGGRIVSP